MELLAQTADPTGFLSNPAWANAGMGGIVVVALLVLAYFFKQWVEERRANAQATVAYTQQLVDVIEKTNGVIGNNTQAIIAVCKQSDGLALDMRDIRDRLLKLKCMAEAGD